MREAKSYSMPLYNWKCKKTGLVVEVLRSFKDYQNPPEDTELTEEERGKERDWERIIGADIKVIRAPGFGGKGRW